MIFCFLQGKRENVLNPTRLVFVFIFVLREHLNSVDQAGLEFRQASLPVLGHRCNLPCPTVLFLPTHLLPSGSPDQLHLLDRFY